MATFRYRYSGVQPQSIFAPLNLYHTSSADSVRDIPALVDTGAEITVLPIEVIEQLGLEQFGSTRIAGYDSRSKRIPTYYLKLQLRDFHPIPLEVVGLSNAEYAVLGRDLLNRYVITLDGPKGLMIVTDE